jgi:hypothetical protein
MCPVRLWSALEFLVPTSSVLRASGLNRAISLRLYKRAGPPQPNWQMLLALSPPSLKL